jgi:hypothetical protein
MNRLTDLFEQFSLLEITLILRRTALVAAVIGVVALVVSGLLGHLLIGAGAVLGLGLGLLNIRLVTLSVARAGASSPDSGEPDPGKPAGKHSKVRRVIASNTMLRLGVTTGIIFALVFTVRELGMGALGGVALFYFVFLGNVMRSLFQQGVAA